MRKATAIAALTLAGIAASGAARLAGMEGASQAIALAAAVLVVLLVVGTPPDQGRH